MLKMSTGRYASVLAIFAIFLREYIDKTNKKVHNKFTNEYRHIQEHGSRGIFVRAQRNGVRIPDAERHCKVYVFSDWRSSAVTRGSGEGFAERTGESPRTKSGYSVPISTLGFPKGAVCECIKTFAPRFEKTLVLFYCGNQWARTRPFFTM